MKREFARTIAEQHIRNMNPLLWNGNGKRPASFDTRICTYDIQSKNGNELDISFEIEEGNWIHYCELKDKKQTIHLSLYMDMGLILLKI